MAFRRKKKESVLKTKDPRKLVGWYLKSKFLPGDTANGTRHPNIPVSCLAKKNNSFCHPDKNTVSWSLQSIEEVVSAIWHPLSAYHTVVITLIFWCQHYPRHKSAKKTGNINRNIQSMTRLCNIAPICYTSCQKSSIPLQHMQSRPVTKRRKTYESPHPPPPPTRVQRTKHNLVWMQTCDWQSQPHPNTHSKFHTDLGTS